MFHRRPGCAEVEADGDISGAGECRLGGHCLSQFRPCGCQSRIKRRVNRGRIGRMQAEPDCGIFHDDSGTAQADPADYRPDRVGDIGMSRRVQGRVESLGYRRIVEVGACTDADERQIQAGGHS